MRAGAEIKGIGAALPKRVVTNEELGPLLGVEPGWIEARTGIHERRFVDAGESTGTLAVQAATRALETAGSNGDDIDLVVAATCTPDHLFPPTSALIQHELGLGHVAAFDLNAACSGFVYALASAASALAAEPGRRALVVGCDALSRHLPLDDARTACLFGDGAGAVVLESSEEVMAFILGADGAGGNFVSIPAGGNRMPASAETLAAGLHCIQMQGREVYRSAVRTMSLLAREMGVDDFDIVVAHQANKRIVDDVARELGLAPDRMVLNIDHVGNTSAASIPLALTEAWESGRLTPGMRALLVAFGAGYTWGAAGLTWTLPVPAEATSELIPEVVG